MGRLAACEEKFLRSRAVDTEEVKSTPLALGTLMHRLIQTTMLRRDWRQEFLTACHELPFWTPEYRAPTYFETAEWLMERYEKHYAGDPRTTIAVEIPFDLPLPGMESEARVRGYIDGLANGPNGLELVELKTMGRWAKADRAGWEPQLHTYLWAARELGLPVTGALFRAIYTYRFRGKEERSESESFRDVWVEHDQAQIDRVLDDFRRTARRGLYLIEHPEDAVRNVGEGCLYCPHKFGCVLPA